MLRQAGAAHAAHRDEEEGGHSDALLRLPGQTAMEALLGETRENSWEPEYRACRPALEARFRRWFPSLRGQESDFYNEAWESLLRQDEVENVRAFLSRAMYARGVDEMRRDGRRPRGSADADSPAVAAVISDRTDRLTDERALDGLDGRERQMLLLDRLTSRQQRIVFRLRARRRDL